MFFTMHKHTWKEDKIKEMRTFESHSWICYCSDLSIHYHLLTFFALQISIAVQTSCVKTHDNYKEYSLYTC